jgi:diguanylate cyclase (GGDEF)-like protein
VIIARNKSKFALIYDKSGFMGEIMKKIKRMNKIRNKILVSIIGCALIMSSIVGSVIFVQNLIGIKQEARDKIEARTVINGKQLDIEFIKAQTIVRYLNSTVEGMVDVNKLKVNPLECEKSLVPLMETINKDNSGFIGLYVVFNPDITKDVHEIFFQDAQGTGVYKRIENDSLSDFNPKNPEMAWYYDAIKQKKGVWSNPYFDDLGEKSKVEMISYTEPVYKNGIMIAVVGIDIRFEQYVKIVNYLSVEEGGYTFLLNNNYDYIVHKKFTSKDNFKRIMYDKYSYNVDVISKNKSGYFEIDFEGEKKLLGYATLENGWFILTSIPEKAIFHDMSQRMMQGVHYAFIAMILGLIIASRVAVLISRKISHPVILATHFAEELAKGNLDEKLYIDSGDETETLGKSLNKAGENISSLIEELKSAEEELIYQVEELRKSEDVISVLAYNNPITGMNNRNYALKNMPLVLKELKDKKEQGALICLNIDNFRVINDTLGHSIGNEFLKEVSELLKEYLKNHQFLCHLGADEFGFFLQGINNINEVEDFLEKLLNVFRQAITAGGYEILYTTVSLGVALYPYNGNDVETLFKNADIALNYAKNNGKNTYKIFDESINLMISEKLQLENSLRKAIDNNELQVYYQPKVDLKTGKTVSMEALARWISPTLGFISPVKFIPLAEETGLIHAIGEFVLKEACRQNKIWHEKGFNSLKVAVNLSGKQLKQENLFSIIRNVLEETSLEAEWLELEITESILIDNFDNNIKRLQKLKAMGINIYLDDFGTGYSSLTYLRKLPIDFIKIDKSFIDGITINSKDGYIASSLIDLAHGIDLSVVAEGVETIEQLDLLKSYGCDGIQGYYFSKPLNAHDFEKFLEINGLHDDV